MSLLDDFGFRPARIGIAIIVILLAGTAFTTWRNARIDALAHSALDKKSDVNAVKRLAGYSGQRSAELLGAVASGAQSQQVRLAALQALVDRKDVARVSRLSELMLPTENLAMRQALANAIYQTGCSVECVRNILYFEERMWRGDRPAERSQRIRLKDCLRRNRSCKRRWMKFCARTKLSSAQCWRRIYGLAGPVPQSIRSRGRVAIGRHRSLPAVDADLSHGQRECEVVAGV